MMKIELHKPKNTPQFSIIQKNIKIIYKTILKKEYQNYSIIGQSIWD